MKERVKMGEEAFCVVDGASSTWPSPRPSPARRERGPVARRALACTVVLVGVGVVGWGCGTPACPPGSHDEMGRCVADGDAAIDAAVPDAPGLDAPGLDAPGLDAPPPDAYVVPDACVLQDLFEDRDMDGHGDPARPIRACSAGGAVAAVGDDCDDAAATIYPAAPELCNGEDDDCDAATDEGIQRLVGTPSLLEADTIQQMHAVGAASSYVVAFDAYTSAVIRGVWLRRYDADGTPVTEPSLTYTGNPPPLLRIVPFSPTDAVLWFASGDFDPRELRGGIFPVATVLTAPPLMLGSLEASTTATFAAAADHVAVYVAPGGMVTAARFDRDTLMPLGMPAPLPTILRDRPRSVHPHESGAMLLETIDPTTLDAVVLDRTSFSTLLRATLPVTGSFANLAVVDGDGRVFVLAGDADVYSVVRFRVADLSATPVPFTRDEFTVEAPLGGTGPSLVTSRAGADLVLGVLTAGGGGLSWHHFDATGGSGTSAIVETGQEVVLASVARISSRRGAIFYVVTNGGGGNELYMQRIGCE